MRSITFPAILVGVVSLFLAGTLSQSSQSRTALDFENKSCLVTTQYLNDPPYKNYFYSDCNVDAQAVVTSPLGDSNLSIIGPRLIIAWPAGNSGICTFFRPQSGKNGSLAVELVNSTYGTPLGPVYQSSVFSKYPFVGIEGVLTFNTSAELFLTILGSIRTIRDFTEGPSLLQPVIQEAITVHAFNGTGVAISRRWLDNVTVSTLTMVPFENPDIKIRISNGTAKFGAGFYRIQAFFNYPQLTQLSPQQVLNDASQGLIEEQSSQSTSLSFLSYSEKLLAGAWRFLTYFGRDSMIAALLLEPVLSSGNASALEAVIGAVLERVNRTDGSVCHEETIGDYATYLNLQRNITSAAPGFVYPMIDTDYFLPILMSTYFNSSPERIEPLLSRTAGSVDLQNQNLTYSELAYINAQKIMNITAAFERQPSIFNMIALKQGELVGQWRDSTYGLANGRIPFDVNCALVPAALKAISTLASQPGVFPNTSETCTWSSIARSRAIVWETKSLPFFEQNLTIAAATRNLEKFVHQSTFYSGPTNADSLSIYSADDVNTQDSKMITTYAISINSTTNPIPIPILHTDTAFHLFFLNLTSNQNLLTRFLNSTANAILRPFPAGLTTPVGLVVANPALSGDDILIANFTNSAYHGTVVWSWQLALMAKGLERQLSRCSAIVGADTNNITASTGIPPDFCTDTHVYNTLLQAYDTLWTTIEANTALLQSEVWSFTYNNLTSQYTQVALGALPPPPGVSSGTESNVRQLWSLTFLAVRRNPGFRVSSSSPSSLP